MIARLAIKRDAIDTRAFPWVSYTGLVRTNLICRGILEVQARKAKEHHVSLTPSGTSCSDPSTLLKCCRDFDEFRADSPSVDLACKMMTLAAEGLCHLLRYTQILRTFPEPFMYCLLEHVP